MFVNRVKIDEVSRANCKTKVPNEKTSSCSVDIGYSLRASVFALKRNRCEILPCLRFNSAAKYPIKNVSESNKENSLQIAEQSADRSHERTRAGGVADPLCLGRYKRIDSCSTSMSLATTRVRAPR